MARLENRLDVILKHLNPKVEVRRNNLYLNNVSASQLQPTSSIRHNEEFQYTLNNPHLSLEQRRFYEENGFLVIPKLVNDEDIDRYTQRFLDICNGTVDVQSMTLMKDISFLKMKLSEKTANKLQDFIFDSVLREYCFLPQILDYVECIIGPNIMAMHTMLINKPPDAGTMSSRHPLHQDMHYFPFRPANKIVCSWTAMQHVNRENGCLVAIPGSHKGEMRKHDYPNWEGKVNKLYYGVQDLTQDEMDSRAFLEMDKGDTVFFHPHLLHGSGTNRTSDCRKSISCHYAASDCEYVNVKDTSQQNMEHEIMDLAAKRGLVLDDFSLVWRVKGVLTRGETINL